jgi:polyhydroxybutyrate depolymerase
MRSLIISICVMMFLQGVTGCSKRLPQDRAVGPETYEVEMDIQANGFNRTYQIHIPPDLHAEKLLPLVVVIHGAFDTGLGMEKFSGFSKLADRENFMVLYPDGMGLFGFLQHWNAGHCCGKAAKDNVDDVGFIAAAIEDACRRLNVDQRRIYILGFSNGGMMAYRFAAEKTDMLAGAAFLAASIGGRASEKEPEWRIPDPQRPLPVLIMHGLEDRDVPYEGGVSPRRGGPRTYWSVPDSVDFWVKFNGCKGAAKEDQFREGRVIVKSWDDCSHNAAVSLWLIQGWGHDWPGPYFTASLAQDDPLKDFDAAEILWDFFKNHVATNTSSER